MTIKTFNLWAGNTAFSPNWFGPMAETAGGSLSQGWKAGGLTAPIYIQSHICGSVSSTTGRSTSYIDGTTGPTPGTDGAANTGDSWATQIPYTGTFAAGNWTGNYPITGSGGGGSSATGTIRTRIWASQNANGSAARELTSGANTPASQTLASNGSLGAFAPIYSLPQIILNNEYLFVQAEGYFTTVVGTTVNWGWRGGTLITPDFQVPSVGSHASIMA